MQQNIRRLSGIYRRRGFWRCGGRAGEGRTGGWARSEGWAEVAVGWGLCTMLANACTSFLSRNCGKEGGIKWAAVSLSCGGEVSKWVKSTGPMCSDNNLQERTGREWAEHIKILLLFSGAKMTALSETAAYRGALLAAQHASQGWRPSAGVWFCFDPNRPVTKCNSPLF